MDFTSQKPNAITNILIEGVVLEVFIKWLSKY